MADFPDFRELIFLRRFLTCAWAFFLLGCHFTLYVAVFIFYRRMGDLQSKPPICIYAFHGFRNIPGTRIFCYFSLKTISLFLIMPSFDFAVSSVF